MVGYAAPLRGTPPRRRVEHIKAMAAEIGARQREVMHLLVLTGQALYLLFAVTCVTAGIVNEANGKHDAAVVWIAVGGAMLLVWLFVKVLSKALRKFVRALKAEMSESGTDTPTDTDTDIGDGFQQHAPGHRPGHHHPSN